MINKKEDVMKKDGIQTFIQIDKEMLEKLIAEVKETVAAIIHLPQVCQ
jgi:hypothetical protein